MIIVATQCLLCVGCLLCSTGCLMWTPGNQAAAGLKTSKLITWDENDNIHFEVEGPQTDELLVAGGEVRLLKNPDTDAWELDPASVLEYVLYSNPKATDARDVSLAYGVESTKQGAQLADFGRALIEALPGLITAAKAPPTPPPEPEPDDGGG
jgi:hypothetical protein